MTVKTTNTMTVAIPQNTNKFGGFYRTMHTNKRRAWNAAIIEFNKGTKCAPEAVRVWLESRYGRHFADSVNEEVWTYRQFVKYSIEDIVALRVKTYLRTGKASFIREANEWYSDELSSKVASASENA